ncbi:MAG: hypothetical protein CL927_10165 [Deltaproteobacteria bacterium]|nr:hypothetical protein [Deltaproteobacteria bacterium]HCH62989.1 hypothetical protein [Deltaproteobacteria bacterium]
MSTNFEPTGFGRYVLVDKIAVGGMAEVFKAKSFSEGGFEKLLVIKRILQHLSENDDFVEMFIDEAKISVELQHPNIVQIFDFGKTGENWYIAMELVEGKDAKGILRRLARQRKLMPPKFALFIAHQTCKGLQYAHSKADLRGKPLHIIHRDISPSNLIVGYNGQVKVADFGIAKAEKSTYNTKDGVLKGKFEYMSPEQARGESVTPQSDVFACGIILHEMLTGRRLFKSDSDIKTLETIKSGKYPRPSDVNPRISGTLDDIVMKALALDPTDRFADARAMRKALGSAILQELANEDNASGEPKQMHDPAARVQDDLRQFMEALFANDITAERDRLQAASSRAAELKQDASEADTVTVAPVPSVTVVQPAPSASRLPLLLAGAAVVLLGSVVVVLALREPETRIIEVQAASALSTTVSVQLVIGPEGAEPTVFIDEAVIADGTLRVYAESLSPDVDHNLRIEAPGFETYTDTLQAAAGEKVRLKVQLREVGTPKETEAPSVVPPAPSVDPTEATAPSPAAVDAAIAFASAPSGAEVLVNGQSIGRTPTTWNGAKAGVAYKVQYRKAGYRVTTAKVQVPTEGGTISAKGRLKAEKVDPGELFVNVKGGWGEVWIDGTRVDTTPLKHQLPAGTYTVKVVNAEAGLEETRKVTIVPGKTQKLMFSL